MSTFKLPKYPRVSVGRGPGGPGAAHGGCVPSGQSLPSLGSNALSYKPMRRGRGAHPLVLSLWNGHFRCCLEERCFSVTLNLSVTIVLHLSCAYTLVGVAMEVIAGHLAILCTSGNVWVWEGILAR